VYAAPDQDVCGGYSKTPKSGVEIVDGHEDLPSGGHEVDVMAITASDRIRWWSRREICSDRRLWAVLASGGYSRGLHADHPVM
jgi:hypothetical protein